MFYRHKRCHKPLRFKDSETTKLYNSKSARKLFCKPSYVWSKCAVYNFFAQWINNKSKETGRFLKTQSCRKLPTQTITCRVVSCCIISLVSTVVVVMNSPPWSSKATRVRIPASLLWAAWTQRVMSDVCCSMVMVRVSGCAVVVDMLVGRTGVQSNSLRMHPTRHIVQQHLWREAWFKSNTTQS